MEAHVIARSSARRRATQLGERVSALEQLLSRSKETVRCAREDSDFVEVAAAMAAIQTAERLLAQLQPQLHAANTTAMDANREVGRVAQQANLILDELVSARSKGAAVARLPDNTVRSIATAEAHLASLIGPPVTQA